MIRGKFNGYSETQKWNTTTGVDSRNGLIKLCTLIAGGIDREIIKSRIVTINISGDEEVGKSLVSDVITATLVDSQAPYNYPISDKSNLENRPCDAMNRFLVKSESLQGTDIMIAFSHPVNRNYREPLKQKISSIFNDYRKRGVVFVSTKDMQMSKKIDIKIIILGIYSPCGSQWRRAIKVEIDSPDLRTEKMKNTLERIALHARQRKKRLGLGCR